MQLFSSELKSEADRVAGPGTGLSPCLHPAPRRPSGSRLQLNGAKRRVPTQSPHCICRFQRLTLQPPESLSSARPRKQLLAVSLTRII